MPKKPTGRPKLIETAALKARIVELRTASYKWREIAEAVDRSIPYCHNLYFQALAEVPADQVVQARQEECQLVESAVHNLLKMATDDSVTARTRVEAWNSIRGWSEHRAKMVGLNAPVKSQVLHISESQVDEELKRLEAQIALNERSRIIEHEEIEPAGPLPAELMPPDAERAPVDLDGGTT